MKEPSRLQKSGVLPPPRAPAKRFSKWIRFTLVATLAVSFVGCGKKKEPAPATGAMDPNMPGMGAPAAGKTKVAGIPGRGVVELTGLQRQLIDLRTTLVETQAVESTVRAVGMVTYDESKVADLNSRVMGWVQKLFVDKPGEEVTKGEPLMELYSPVLYSAKQDYQLAWRSARAARNSGDGKYAGARVTGAEAVLQSSRKRLELFGIGAEQIDALETAHGSEALMEIVAPLSGTVIEKDVIQGKMIQPNMPLYRIADLSEVWVEAEIYEYEVPLVKVGQEAKVTVASYPDRVFTGKVNFIYPYLQGQTRTVKVRIVLANPGGTLKPAMYANVELESQLGEQLTVPASAVFDTGERQYVFVQQADGVFVPKKIELGVKAGEVFTVHKGLTPGDRVVVDGNFLLDSESQLKAGGGMKMKM